MKEQGVSLTKELIKNLEGLVKVYRVLLSTVRNERELLISSNIAELEKSNRAKEAMLLKVKKLDEERLKISREIAISESLDPENIRLLELAKHFGGERGDRLRELHSVLDLLLGRVKEINQQNEILVRAALENVTGGISSIRDSLSENKVYKKGGKVNAAPAESGQLVRREA